MATTNRERVGRALELLSQGLGPFVEREVFASVNAGTVQVDTSRRFAEDPILANKPIAEWDAAGLLKLMWETWNEVFRKTLGPAERTLVSELREVRNRWAHQEAFSTDDAYRALDSVHRLLSAISAGEGQEVDRMKTELLRIQYEEKVRSEKRKAGGSLIEAAASGALKPWREVVTPHPDVASGRYQQAEFAADLWQVHLGEGSEEYCDSREFYRRTYLTESLKQLLVNAVQRLSGQGGDPVVQLQTNFGGGKTHAMLALYHLLSGIPPSELAGVDNLLAAAGVTAVPKARRVVLVGNRISPGNPVTKPDGTVVRTLWGELAWQLGGTKAYARVAADDERATSPGDALRELFKEHGPCLILIDEWVAYARQLHDSNDLPAGSFDTQFTFAQALTESAKLAGNCLLVISLPASDTQGSPHAQADDVEVGGIRGREALDRLRNVVGRLESSWRPASAEEGFEIVRRRLFEPLSGPEAFTQRDITARAFGDLYRAQRPEFPPECPTVDYEQRIKAAYPIHPEVFDQLYGGWSTLAKFQRTRGVLRLMAAVIHCLWRRGDKNPLILPCTIPMDDPRVCFELTHYLSDNWVPVIDKDVDGPNALPLKIDGEVPNLGKYAAVRRVARTIYLGSAPTASAAHRGIEDRHVRLGCVMPGESPAVFGDALRRLAGAATFLYQDGPRYWYSTQATVAKLAEDRAEQLTRNPDAVEREIEKRVRVDVSARGEFTRVHAMPRSSSDVPDDPDARLVVLGVEYPYSKEPENPAETKAKEILETRGNSPRIYRNTLVFLAVDKARLQDLEEAGRRYLAWESILAETEQLDLSPHQVKQAEAQRSSADTAIAERLAEAYQWLLAPVQKNPRDAVTLQAVRLFGDDGLAVRASKRLCRDEDLVTRLAGTRLRKELDDVPLWRGNHVEIGQLCEDFARYVYLPRVKDPSVIVEAARDGVALLTWEQDSFAFADRYDEAAGRYVGLRCGQQLPIPASEPRGLLVKSEVARQQLDVEAPLPSASDKQPEAGAPLPPAATLGSATAPPSVSEKPKPRRFHGSIRLDPIRVGRDAGVVATEVISHLSGLVGASVTVSLEIDASLPNGAPENVVRTVTENCRTLKFDAFGFEEE